MAWSVCLHNHRFSKRLVVVVLRAPGRVVGCWALPCQVCVSPGCCSDIDFGAQAYVTASLICRVLCKDCTSGMFSVRQCSTAAE
jgi:hypothetical protein